jgi:pilus assembly protein CpaB
MADRRYTFVLYVAIAVALLATLGVYRSLQSAQARNQLPTAPVVVAAEDVPEGASIGRLAVTVKPYPTAAVPEGAYSSVDSVVGRVARIPIFKGEALVPGRLAPEGTGPGLEVKIAPGKRAMAVKINEVAGLSGLIQPNSRVDVLVTLREDDSRDKQVAKLFMSNMRVLSVGQHVDRGRDGQAITANTAALEVTPDEAERLAVAMNQGSIQLVLRGYGDPDSVKTKGANSKDVLAQLRAAAPVVTPAPEPRREEPRRTAPPPRPTPQPVAPPPATVVATPKPAAEPPRKPDSLTVQVFRGDKVSQQKFAKPDTVRSPSQP